VRGGGGGGSSHVVPPLQGKLRIFFKEREIGFLGNIVSKNECKNVPQMVMYLLLMWSVVHQWSTTVTSCHIKFYSNWWDMNLVKFIVRFHTH
jgi:hypothetical protein